MDEPEKNQEPNDYALKVDAQVEKFVELKQKLTYFLITGSVAVIAFLVNFVINNPNQAGQFLFLVIISVISGLLTSGFSLLNLHYELNSYRLHLKYRYEKINWEDLDNTKRSEWNEINDAASKYLTSAFIFLFIEILFAVIFFILYFHIPRNNPLTK